MFERFSCGFLVLTYECNNRCEWCYAKSANFAKGQMPLDKAKQLLKFMKELGIGNVGLIGGEPTLYKGIIELIKYGKSLGLTHTLYSNGRSLADETFVRQLKESGLDFIHVSVQSCDPGIHEAVVGVKGAFAETKKGIENAVKHGLDLNLSAVLSTPDFEIYRSLIEYFSFAKPRWIFFREVPIIGIDKKLKEQKILSNRESAALMEKIYFFAKSRGIEPVIYARMPLCWFMGTKLEPLVKTQQLFGHCHVYSAGSLIVDVNCKALPCAQWLGMHVLDLFKDGRMIPKEEFLEAWGKKQKELVEALIQYPDERCKECKLWGEYCTGGCPLLEAELPEIRSP